MYSFQANAGRRRDKHRVRLLCIALFVLIIALAGVSYSFVRASSAERATSEALYARALSEAADAQSAVYRLTQSSGANTITLLATVRSHVYALQTINVLAANIFGPGTAVADSALLDACVATLDQCEARWQSGLVLTSLFTELRDNVDLIVASFGGATP